jgi:hypothetical protein
MGFTDQELPCLGRNLHFRYPNLHSWLEIQDPDKEKTRVFFGKAPVYFSSSRTVSWQQPGQPYFQDEIIPLISTCGSGAPDPAHDKTSVAFGVQDTWIILQPDGRLQCDYELDTNYPKLTAELERRKRLPNNNGQKVVSFVTDETSNISK